jgi:hypothetical protein
MRIRLVRMATPLPAAGGGADGRDQGSSLEEKSVAPPARYCQSQKFLPGWPASTQRQTPPVVFGLRGNHYPSSTQYPYPSSFAHPGSRAMCRSLSWAAQYAGARDATACLRRLYRYGPGEATEVSCPCSFLGVETSTGFLHLCYTAHSYSIEDMRRDKESTSMGHHLDTGMQAGTITALTVQQHQPTRVSVFLDGAFAFGVCQISCASGAVGWAPAERGRPGHLGAAE